MPMGASVHAVQNIRNVRAFLWKFRFHRDRETHLGDVECREGHRTNDVNGLTDRDFESTSDTELRVSFLGSSQMRV